MRAMGLPRSVFTQAGPCSGPKYRVAASAYSGPTSSSNSTLAFPRTSSTLCGHALSSIVSATLGYPAARFTEPRENFNHEHQNVQVVNGVQFGDLIDFVDFNYIARVTAVNAATVWALATALGSPKGLQIHTTPPGTSSGTNLTTLTWNANPESNLAKYEVVTRETTAAGWTDTIDVGNVTTVTLDISKDNVQFGLVELERPGAAVPQRRPVHDGYPSALDDPLALRLPGGLDGERGPPTVAQRRQALVRGRGCRRCCCRRAGIPGYRRRGSWCRLCAGSPARPAPRQPRQRGA